MLSGLEVVIPVAFATRNFVVERTLAIVVLMP
jgi:hypothetical protein